MKISNILFLDIETVSQFPTYEQLPNDWKILWDQKAQSFLQQNESETVASLYSRAGLYAEFGKIVCISCGYLVTDNNKRLKMETHSFHDKDERKLLQAFAAMLNGWKCADGLLCAHNGKEFDFPYICRRMIINGIKLPAILDITGKKPWEIKHIDTLEIWKFGDFKARISLNLMAKVLNVPSSKDDIDGSQVHEVYWVQKDVPRIVRYCEKDILTLGMIYCKLVGILNEHQSHNTAQVSSLSNTSLPFYLQKAS
jgi:hypothetical protein